MDWTRAELEADGVVGPDPVDYLMRGRFASAEISALRARLTDR